MDLNLYLGHPRSPRRLRRVVLGSALASPSPSPPPPEEQLPPHSAGMPAAPEPYSPSRASIAAAVGAAAPGPPIAPDRRPPPFSGGDPVPEYSPRSPSYLSLAASYVLYDPSSTARLADGPLLGGGGGGGGGGSAHVRYSPSYLPLSAIPEDHDDVNFAPYRPSDVGSADILEGHDGSSLHPDFVEPEFRFRRLIELQRRARDGSPSRSSRPYEDEPPEYPLEGEMMGSDVYARNSRKNNVDGEGISGDGLEEEKEEKNASAVNFECNICLDLAQEPVVTSCGHLFCWPCLYQWLHHHCNHSECPVCKGEVIESSITPIYGRGNPETSTQDAGDGDSGLKIPPRPRGRRIESWRQRIRRPISRRFSVGIANTWRRVLGEEMHASSRIDGDVEASLREMINSAHRRVAPRLRARRSTRVEANLDNLENASFGVDHSLPSRNAPSNQQSEENTSSVLRDGLNHMPRISFVDFEGSFASMSANLSRIFGWSADSGSHSGAPASSGNPQISDDLIRRPSAGPSQLMDRPSASSTMAVIQEDGGIMDVAVEPNSAGTSRPLRRRGRSNSSLDVDGCVLHARKRRRLD